MSKSKAKTTKYKKGAKKKAAPKTAGTKRPKKTTDAKAKRLSALDAAAQVLTKAGQPMRARELVVAMAEQGLWKSPAGKTPSATLYAAMLREINAKGKDARFAKTDRGLFTTNG